MPNLCQHLAPSSINSTLTSKHGTNKNCGADVCIPVRYMCVSLSGMWVSLLGMLFTFTPVNTAGWCRYKASF